MIKLSWAPGVKYKYNLLLCINYTHVHMLQNIQTIYTDSVSVIKDWHHSKVLARFWKRIIGSF